MKQDITQGGIIRTRCQVCHIEDGKVFRCSRCRKAWYCSVACQSSDWKSEHRYLCKKYQHSVNESVPSDNWQSKRNASQQHVQAKKAYEELSKLVCSSSLSVLNQDFNVANDMVKTLQREVKDFHATPKNVSPPILSKKDATNHTKNMQQNLQKSSFEQIPAYNPIDFWQIYCEDMQHLKCYQLLFRPKIHVGKIALENVQVCLCPPSNTSNTSKNMSNTVLSVVLDYPKITSNSVKIEMQRDILPESCSVCIGDANEAISIRLAYSPIEPIEETYMKLNLLKPSQSIYLACKECKHRVVSGIAPTGRFENDTQTEVSSPTKIKRVLPLASSRWDDMEDYLICYAGQPVVDFGLRATSSQRHVLFEDETVIVAHRQDVGKSACVLAIPGYGQEDEKVSKAINDKSNRNSTNGTPQLLENLDNDIDPSALFRGKRNWRDAVDGATLTCSQCASVLGFAPIDLSDTYRFLKHRLLLFPYPRTLGDPCHVESDLSPAPSFPTVANFICYEMIRYAETKAIFSFAVTKEASKSHAKRDCLLLRLLSWDSLTCCISSPSNHKNAARMMQWSKTAKLLYSNSHEHSNSKNLMTNESMDIWMWAKSDWCCQQPVDSKTEENEKLKSESIVRICLSDNEWNEISRELTKSSQHFSKEVVEAVVYATTGKTRSEHDEIKLASIPLTYIA